MNFTPDQREAQKVPFFEDATRSEGWQGYTTTKNTERLKNEVKDAIHRLGGFVVDFRQGTFHVDGKDRQGFQVHYVVAGRPARLDIAALPVKDRWNTKKKEQSLKMALYMLAAGLNGAWFMQQLIPGYAPLMPMMLGEDGKTISQLWSESSVMSRLLPPGDGDFIEAEIKD